MNISSRFLQRFYVIAESVVNDNVEEIERLLIKLNSRI